MSKIKTSFNVVEEKSARLAVLIDADNASAKSMKAILEEVATFGEATVKRIYGNFVGTKNSSWTQVINEHAIKPMQQFEFTTGKNATDGFMIIDAMDLLYTDRIDGFAIVSSDSDFTALAIRIKEQGATVYGFGKKQTPEAFRNACSHFTYVENLTGYEAPAQPPIAQAKEEHLAIKKEISNTNNKDASQTKSQNSSNLPLDKIKQVFDAHDTEWISVASLGSQWKLLQVDFDPRTYGFKKLGDLVKSYTKVFDVEERSTGTSDHKNLYVRLKKTK